MKKIENRNEETLFPYFLFPGLYFLHLRPTGLHLSARGLMGEPTAPVTRSGGATSWNS